MAVVRGISGVATAAVAGLAIFLAAGEGRAANSFRVSPGSVVARPGVDTRVRITWRASLENDWHLTLGPGTFTVAGSGAVLGTTPAIGELDWIGGSELEQRKAENLTIPGDAVDAALAAGATGISYSRTFFLDGSAGGSAALSIAISVPPPVPSAAVLDVEADPARARVAVGESPILSVGWRARGGAAADPAAAIASAEAAFVSGSGFVFERVATPLTLRHGAGAASGAERVRVPAAVVYQAFQRGEGLRYVREFSSGAARVTGALELDLVGGGAGTFALARLELSFADGSLATVVPAGTPLGASAVIAYSGQGILRGRWELSGPHAVLAAGTGVSPFRTLAHVRQGLPGSGRTRLESPLLPVAEPGVYLVRFRVESPALDVEPPAIRYFVGLGGAGGGVAGGRVVAVRTHQPREGGVLSAATTFSWSPVPGALIYRIEVYPAGYRDPLAEGAAVTSRLAMPHPTPGLVTGVVVPGGATSGQFTKLARRHLESDRLYLWRVLAVGEGGSMLGASPLQEIRTE